MAIPRPQRRGRSSQPSTKPRYTDQHGSHPISPPPSSQSIGGSSPQKSECHITNRRSQRMGHRAKGEKASMVAGREPSPLTSTSRQGESKGDPATGVTINPVPPSPSPSPKQSQRNQDAHASGVGAGATRNQVFTTEERIQILKICYEHRNMLLDCQPTTFGSEEGFWGLILETVKANVRQVLPSTVSKWPALKEYVNFGICRNRREKTEGHDVPPRRTKSPLFYELDTWIDKWNEVLRFRDVQVFESKLFNAVKDLFGKSRLADLIGETAESDMSMDGSDFSIYLPGISEAIDLHREQLEHPSDDSRSSSEELSEEIDHPHNSSVASADHRPRGSVSLNAIWSIENSLESEEEQEHMEDVLKTPSWTQKSSVETRGRFAGSREASNTSEEGSVILGSTPSPGSGVRQGFTRHRSESTSQNSISPSPLNPCSVVDQDSVRSASVDDEELPELTKDLFSTQSSKQGKSSSFQSMPKPSTVYKGPPRDKMILSPKSEGGQPQKNGNKDKGTDKGNMPKDSCEECEQSSKTRDHGETSSIADSSNPPTKTKRSTSREFKAKCIDRSEDTHRTDQKQGRIASRTPALVTKENTRYALKHSKPLVPVSVPHRNEPTKQTNSIDGSRPRSHDEIDAPMFYASSWGKPPERPIAQPVKGSSGRGFVLPPPIETPISTPNKSLKDHRTLLSVACRIATRQTVECFKGNSSDADDTQVPDEKDDEFVVSDLETWYNQNTNIPLTDQNMNEEAESLDLVDFFEDDQDSSERSYGRDIEDTPASSVASQAIKCDSSSRSTDAKASPVSEDSEKEKSIRSLDVGIRSETETPKSKKRKRSQHSLPVKETPVYSPFAPSDIINPSAVSVSKADASSPSATQFNKRQKRRSTCNDREASESTKPDQDTQSSWNYDATPSPTPPKEQQIHGTSPSSSLHKQRCKEHTISDRGDGGSKKAPNAKGGTRNLEPNNQQTGRMQSKSHKRQQNKPSPYRPPTNRKDRRRQRNISHVSSQGPSPASAQAFSPARKWDHTQQCDGVPENRFTTPATAVTRSPASSGLFVPSASQSSSGGGRNYRDGGGGGGAHSSRSNGFNKDLQQQQQQQFSEKLQHHRSMRESTECTEDFRRRTPKSRMKGLCSNLSRLQQRQRELDLDVSRLERRIGMCGGDSKMRC